MRSIIMLEIKKAWRNPLSWLAVLVSVFFSVLSLLTDVVLNYEHLDVGVQPEQMTLLAGSSSISVILHGIFIPVLATFPAACSYYEEKKNGTVNAMLTRSTRSSFFTGKALVTLLTGFVVSVLPYLLNYILCLIAVSRKNAISLSTAYLGGVYHYSVRTWLGRVLFPSLYLNHPVLNLLLLIALGGIWGAGMALTAFGVSLYFRKNIVLTAALPAVCVLLAGLLMSAFRIDQWFVPFQFGLYSGRLDSFWQDKIILLICLDFLPMLAGIIMTVLKEKVYCDEL